MSLKKMWEKYKHNSRKRDTRQVRPLPRNALQDADAIITTNEVCDRHGTGVILRRIFGESPNLLSIRSSKLYPEHALGCAERCFGHHALTRPESFEHVLAVLNGTTVRRVLCVPFLADELITAIVLKEVFNVPLCLYVMDDNNIHARGIPDELMREALEKSALRLAISPELRDAYEQKYGLKFWVVPPVVDERVLRPMAEVPANGRAQDRTGVLIGSIWSRAWLTQLRRTIRASGLKVDWYGNTKAPWLEVTAEELQQDGINDCGFLPESELTERLKEYLFALVPSGTLDAVDDRPEIAQLSLPTRMPYLLAASNTPMIVLGSARTAAAGFLSRFEVGKVCPYEPAALRRSVQEICRAEEQVRLRQNAAAASGLFSAKGLADWIWRSLESGEPLDERFERAFCRTAGEIIPYVETPAPKDLQGDFAVLYQAFRRLHHRGYSPDFIIDVGASTGVWSDTAKRIFPKARFILIDPLHSQYVRMNDWFFRRNPDFETIAAAVSDRTGEAELNVSPDLYGSSLLRPSDDLGDETVTVPVVTLDSIAAQRKLGGRGLLKIDVQFTEHLVLAGAEQLLNQVDVLLLELSLFRYAPEAVLFPEMCELVRSLGFNYFEDVGGWRSPVDGTMLQKDVLFVRDSLFVQRMHKPAKRIAVPSSVEYVRESEPAVLAVAAR